MNASPRTELLANGDLAVVAGDNGTQPVPGARAVAPGWWLTEPAGHPAVVQRHDGFIRLIAEPGTRVLQVLPEAVPQTRLRASLRVLGGGVLCGAVLGSATTPTVRVAADSGSDPTWQSIDYHVTDRCDQVVIYAADEGTIVDVAAVSLTSVTSTDRPAAAAERVPAATMGVVVDHTSGTTGAAAPRLAAGILPAEVSASVPLPGAISVSSVSQIPFANFLPGSETLGKSLEDLGLWTYVGPDMGVDTAKLAEFTRSVVPPSSRPSLRDVARVNADVSPLLTDMTAPVAGAAVAPAAPLNIADRRRVMNEPDDVDVERRRVNSYLAKHAVTHNQTTGPGPLPAVTVPMPGIGTSLRDVRLSPDATAHGVPTLALIEDWELRTYLGEYGIGRTIQTFSLLPGERTTITVNTWRNDSSTREDSTSIFDSSDTAAETRFSNAVSNQSGSAFQDQGGWSLSVAAKVEAGGSIGLVSGSASLEAGFAANHQEASQRFANAMTQAASEHANQANNSRRQAVQSASTSTTASGAETTTVRELANTNLRRVLNFLFRELNQVYETNVVLRGIRVAFYNGRFGSADVVEFSDLPQLLSRHVPPASHEQAARALLGLCVLRFAHTGDAVTTLQVGTRGDRGIYTWTDAQLTAAGDLNFTGSVIDPAVQWRIKPGALTPGDTRSVPGLITAIDQVTMRTDNLLVDALMGEVDALDSYATRLQDLDLDARAADVAWREADTRKTTEALDLVASAPDKIDAWTKIFPTLPQIEVVPAAAATLPSGG